MLLSFMVVKKWFSELLFWTTFPEQQCVIYYWFLAERKRFTLMALPEITSSAFTVKLCLSVQCQWKVCIWLISYLHHRIKFCFHLPVKHVFWYCSANSIWKHTEAFDTTVPFCEDCSGCRWSSFIFCMWKMRQGRFLFITGNWKGEISSSVLYSQFDSY